MSEFQHIVNVEGAVMKDNCLLTIIRSEAEEHAGGTLAFVGGKAEFTEQEHSILETTLKREILEEVGVEVANLCYITSTGFFADDDMSVINIVFLCDWVAGEARAIDPDEVASVHWMTVAEIYAHPKTPIWIKTYTQHIEQHLANSL